MSGKAIFVLLIWSLISIVGQAFEFFGSDSFGKALLVSCMLLPFVIGFNANGIYYRYAKNKIEILSSNAYDSSMEQISSIGGVSVWSAIAIAVLSILVGVPSLAFDEAITNKRNAEVEASRHAEFEAKAREQEFAIAKEKAAEKAESEARAWAGKPEIGDAQHSTITDDQRFQLILRELESRHPELNPESPHYNQDIVNEILKRAEYYQSLGYVRNDAIQLAVSSLEREGKQFSDLSGARH